jgi:protein-tyrosine-phosphatase
MSEQAPPTNVAEAEAWLQRIVGVLAAGGRVQVAAGCHVGLLQASEFLPGPPDADWLLLLPHGRELATLLPALTPAARRHLRRAAAGQVCYQIPAQALAPEAPLPETLRGVGELRLHIPASPWLQVLAEALPTWLIWSTPNAATPPPDLTIELPEELETSAEIVRWTGSEFVTSSGAAWPSEALPIHLMIVCTGNTCRSPMAAAFLEKSLAERLGCEPAKLSAHGWQVQSAGLAARSGEPASAYAQQAARAYGVDLTGHRSQPISGALLAAADIVYGMTAAHCQALAPYAEALGISLQVLAPSGYDISDPFGADLAAYEACAAMLWAAAQERCQQLLGAGDPAADKVP